MTRKHVGGRGRKASHKHQTFSISLPPHLKEALDAAVTAEISRSEVVAGLISAHLVKTATSKKPETAAPVAQKKTPKRPAANLPAAVTVMAQYVPRAARWRPEKYKATERLLAEGYTIRKNSENADYSTEKGSPVSRRIVQALLKLGVVVALDG